MVRELRTRLISDIVTGKVDVRHLAQEMEKVEPEDFKPIDEKTEGGLPGYTEFPEEAGDD